MKTNNLVIHWVKGDKLIWSLNGTVMGLHYNWDELFKHIKNTISDKRLNKDGSLNVYDDEVQE